MNKETTNKVVTYLSKKVEFEGDMPKLLKHIDKGGKRYTPANGSGYKLNRNINYQLLLGFMNNQPVFEVFGVDAPPKSKKETKL